jgi:hypothetical protein
MGQAKCRSAKGTGTSFDELDAKLRRLGIETQQFGFYDQPAFVAIEQANPAALEWYSSWVLQRPRDAAYNQYARTTVRKVASIVEQRLAASRALGACVNAATAMARMLDELGVWSFAVRGSLTIEIPTQPEAGRRYFPECDLLADPEAATGHAWLVAPPFLVVDLTLRHQKWVDLHPAIAAFLPAVVAAENGHIIHPHWYDVISDSAIAANRIPQSKLNDNLPYRFKPELKRIERSLPGRDIRVEGLSLRYIAGGVTVSEQLLAALPELVPSLPDLKPIEIWTNHVLPAFKAALPRTA